MTTTSDTDPIDQAEPPEAEAALDDQVESAAEDDQVEPTEETEPETDQPEPSATDQLEPAEDEPTARRVRWPGQRALAATVVVSLAAVLLCAIAGAGLWSVRAQHDARQRDNAITVAAREEVLNLLTLSPSTVQASLDKVLNGSTGGWRQQFAQEADQFTSVVHTQQVSATATITASAIQSADDDHATVLVSADAVIHNTASPQGYPGVYRVLMNLQAQNGAWLVSDLQFVA